MSLDFYLLGPVEEHQVVCSECGHTYTKQVRGSVDTNITHNLHRMFDAAGIGHILWGDGGQRAGDILPALESGLTRMLEDPEMFKKFNAPNGWGKYEHALSFLRDVISMCRQHPDWVVETSK